MKKQILLALLWAFSALSAVQAQYYIRVNGTTDYEAKQFAEKDTEGRDQYLAANVPLKAGDMVAMYNGSNGDVWVISNLDPYGEYKKFTYTAQGYKCSADGCYDFYIKLMFGNDMLYIGKGANCEGDDPDNPTTYTVAGNAGIIKGDEWDADNTDNDMTLVDGVYVLKLTDLQLAAGEYGYKVVKNHNWATCYPGGENATLSISVDGTYTIEYSYVEGSSEPSAVVTNQKTGETEKPTKKTYASAVPSQCGDVMLQAFYYDSYDNKAYGNTRWASLLSQVSELNVYFDLIWLPPSAKAQGTGYHPEQYSNQNSAWGGRAELKSLISELHAGNTKVVADIVVNHAWNRSTWCDFHPLDFGIYGTFSPDASWITANDEVWAQSASCHKGANAKNDDGYGDEANYAAARDWDHENAKVREMCRAYLKWMYNDMDYDGWRYDYCKGFHNSHVNDYNAASGAYFSVMEYWDGNVNELRSRLQDANWNTLTFDFATKYEALRDGIQEGNYNNLKGRGMLGAGLSKYAVTFVDSHDSFNRSENPTEMYGSGNSMKGSATEGNLNGVLQANAYILAMPGVPCVFYPHWVKLKDYIGPMIMARHACGVHSESSVSDEAGHNFYKAYITGTKGTIYLALGPGSNWGSAPSGFTKAVAINNIGVYYKLNGEQQVKPQLIVTPGSHVFKDSEKGLTITMKAVAVSGTPAIYYTTDGTTPTASSSKYTAPLTIKQTTTLKAVAILNGASSDVQTFTYTYKEPQTTPIKVKFYNNAGWSKVHLWAWTSEGNLFSQGWPGEQLKDPDGDNWYEYTFDAKYKEMNFIFNCGSNACQTSNLWTDEDACYSWSGGAEDYLPTCDVSANKTIKAEDILNIYPNPAHDVLNIESQQVITGVDLYSLTGQLIERQTCETDKLEVPVEHLNRGMYILRVYLNDGWQSTTNFIKQ